MTHDNAKYSRRGMTVHGPQFHACSGCAALRNPCVMTLRLLMTAARPGSWTLRPRSCRRPRSPSRCSRCWPGFPHRTTCLCEFCAHASAVFVLWCASKWHGPAPDVLRCEQSGLTAIDIPRHTAGYLITHPGSLLAGREILAGLTCSIWCRRAWRSRTGLRAPQRQPSSMRPSHLCTTMARSAWQQHFRPPAAAISRSTQPQVP